MGTEEHRQGAPQHIKLGIISVSTTRAITEDKSGQWISKQACRERYDVIFHRVIPDDAATIHKTVLETIQAFRPHALLLTGGTGISDRDVTIDAVHPMFEKELSAFGPLFAMLSFEEIDSAALLSRATAGLIQGTVVFCMPGSIKACQLACNALIFPELGHLIKHVYEDRIQTEPSESIKSKVSEG